jgi:hypothetical protein
MASTLLDPLSRIATGQTTPQEAKRFNESQPPDASHVGQHAPGLETLRELRVWELMVWS